MNLYFRFIWLVIKALFAQKITPLAHSELKFIALPTDCDFNLHITNARYLSFMDLGRTYLIAQLKLISKLYQRKWTPVLQATELSFYKSIALGQQFKLVTALVYWDEKYFYMQQRFIANGHLCALATVKGLFLGNKRKIPTAELLALFDDPITTPAIPEYISNWQQTLDTKKVE